MTFRTGYVMPSDIAPVLGSVPVVVEYASPQKSLLRHPVWRPFYFWIAAIVVFTLASKLSNILWSNPTNFYSNYGYSYLQRDVLELLAETTFAVSCLLSSRRRLHPAVLFGVAIAYLGYAYWNSGVLQSWNWRTPFLTWKHFIALTVNTAEWIAKDYSRNIVALIVLASCVLWPVIHRRPRVFFIFLLVAVSLNSLQTWPVEKWLGSTAYSLVRLQIFIVAWITLSTIYLAIWTRPGRSLTARTLICFIAGFVPLAVFSVMVGWNDRDTSIGYAFGVWEAIRTFPLSILLVCLALTYALGARRAAILVIYCILMVVAIVRADFPYFLAVWDQPHWFVRENSYLINFVLSAMSLVTIGCLPALSLVRLDAPEKPA